MKTLVAALLSLSLSSNLIGAPTSTSSGVIDVGVHVTSTEFRARNYSAYPQVFLFRVSGTSLVTYSTLPSGCLMSFSYAEHALDGVEMEIVSRQGASILRTGTISLDDVAELESQTMWIQRASSYSRTWEQVGGGLLLMQAGPTMLPSPLQLMLSLGVDLPPDPSCVHVPVITPGSNPPGDLPPDLGDEPLPPV
jgi:hypothetical protein